MTTTAATAGRQRRTARTAVSVRLSLPPLWPCDPSSWQSIADFMPWFCQELTGVVSDGLQKWPTRGRCRCSCWTTWSFLRLGRVRALALHQHAAKATGPTLWDPSCGPSCRVVRAGERNDTRRRRDGSLSGRRLPERLAVFGIVAPSGRPRADTHFPDLDRHFLHRSAEAPGGMGESGSSRVSLPRLWGRSITRAADDRANSLAAPGMDDRLEVAKARLRSPAAVPAVLAQEDSAAVPVAVKSA